MYALEIVSRVVSSTKQLRNATLGRDSRGNCWVGLKIEPRGWLYDYVVERYAQCVKAVLDR